MQGKDEITIPEEVLAAIEAARPDCRELIAKLRKAKRGHWRRERALAWKYLAGRWCLAPIDNLRMAFCCDGEPFSGLPKSERSRVRACARETEAVRA